MSDKFITTIENLRKTLEKYGVAIIENVINEQECEAMANGIYDYFEHITKNMDVPFNHKDEKTWRTFYDLYPLNSQLVQHWSIGHCQTSWDLRQNPKIVDIFASFWGVKPEDLLVSFDGLSFHIPPEHTGKGFFTQPKLHVDQSYTRNNFESMQSWITAKDIGKNDATLMCLEKSHLKHKAFGKKFNITDKKDWYKLSDEELTFYADCKEVFIRCKKGSLCLWDSRTVHCGVQSAKGRKVPNERMVIYLCYAPRIDDENTKKKEAFEALRTTNHNPVKVKMFPVLPFTRGNALPNINSIEAPVLTPLGRRLSGY